MSVPIQAGEPTDAALASAYQAGDERAATWLVKRHADSVGRFLYCLGAAASDVEDLVQDVFFRAFRGLEGWRGEASFRSWLLTIAGNRFKDQHRQARNRRMISLEDRDIPDSRDPESNLAADEAAQRLRDGLAGLPRMQREVFLMRVQQGCDYEEIARVLETTRGAARVHYHHAVRRLKELVA